MLGWPVDLRVLYSRISVLEYKTRRSTGQPSTKCANAYEDGWGGECSERKRRWNREAHQWDQRSRCGKARTACANAYEHAGFGECNDRKPWKASWKNQRHMPCNGQFNQLRDTVVKIKDDVDQFPFEDGGGVQKLQVTMEHLSQRLERLHEKVNDMPTNGQFNQLRATVVEALKTTETEVSSLTSKFSSMNTRPAAWPFLVETQGWASKLRKRGDLLTIQRQPHQFWNPYTLLFWFWNSYTPSIPVLRPQYSQFWNPKNPSILVLKPKYSQF